MKKIGAGFAIIIFVKHIVLQVIVMSIVWTLNHFANANIAFWIPMSVLFGLTMLLIVAQMLMLNAGAQKAKVIEEEFYRERKRMFGN